MKTINIKTYAITQRTAIDLSLSENPLGSSPHSRQAIIDAVENAHLYPTQEQDLIALIAKKHGIEEECILLGAGANQLLEDCLKIFALKRTLVVPAATFPESVACMAPFDGDVKPVLLNACFTLDLDALLEACTAETGMIHLCNPNNPTGIWTELSQLLAMAQKSSVPILISEAGADFVGQTMIGPSLPSNVIVVRSFSKAYGLAGLRIGYAVASQEKITLMKSQLRSYRVSSLAIAAAIAAMQDQKHLEDSISYMLQEKAWLMREMSAMGFTIVPSQGQTFIAKVPKTFGGSAHCFCSMTKPYGIGVVDCSLYPGLSQYIRISPQTHASNKKFILILKHIKKGNNHE